MPVPAIDADKRGDAYKKVKPVEGIDEQGLVPDPQVMHVLFARLMAILGPLGILPIIFAVNSVTTAIVRRLGFLLYLGCTKCKRKKRKAPARRRRY